MTTESKRMPASCQAQWRIKLCGAVAVELNGLPLAPPLPARQGRLLFAYLALNRARRMTRDELSDVLWPSNPPASPEAVLSTLLTRLRRTLGESSIRATHSDVQLELGSEPWIDIEASATGAARAQASLAAGDHRVAIAEAQDAVALLDAPLLAEFDALWITERRDELEELKLGCLEIVARAGLELGNAELLTALKAGTTLIRLAPYRDSGYALLMRCHVARGDPMEAVRLFDSLRKLLRDEFGTTPSPALIELHDRLLRHETLVEPSTKRPVPPRVPLPPVIAAALERPFVGRQEPLRRMQEEWRERPSLVFISGEPGIGKTHLTSHLASDVFAAGGTVLYGRCDEDSVVSYQPFQEMLSHYVAAIDSSSLRERFPAATRQLARLIPQLDPGSAHDLSPDADRQRLFEAIETVLRDAANTQALLVIVDDLHWADKPTLMLLRHLLRSLLDPSTMVVGTFRTVDAPPYPGLIDLLGGLRRERGFERIDLHGFDEHETEALLDTTSAARGSSQFIRRLQELTRGNPFFIAETLRSLTELTASPGIPELRMMGVPEGVKEVITRRIARVSPLAAEIMAAAAVAGERFTFNVLVTVLERSEDQVLDALDELIQAGLVVEAPGALDSFSFSHALVRETQYEHINSSRRVRLHYRIGRALEGQGTASHSELAHHFFQARILVGAEASIGYSLKAARHASAALAHEEAAEYYERALVAMDFVEGGSADLRCHTLLDLASALERMHDIDASRERFEEAAVLARTLSLPELLARAAVGFGKWYRYGIPDRAAIDLLEEALSVLPPHDPRSAYALDSLRAQTLGRLAARLDPAEAQDRREALFDEALKIARHLGETETLRALLRAAPEVVCRPDSSELRLSLATEALAEHSHDDNLERVAWGKMNHFLALLEMGRMLEADEALDGYAELVAQLKQPWFDWHLSVVQATHAVVKGELDDAERFARRAQELELDADPNATETWSVQRFMIGRARGRFEDVDEDALRRSAERHGQRPLWRALLARHESAVGSELEARRALDSFSRLELSELTRDQEWLATVTLLAETARVLDDSSRVDTLRRTLAPYRERTVIVDRGWASWGPVAAFL